MRRKKRQPSFTHSRQALVVGLPGALVAEVEDELLPRFDAEMQRRPTTVVIDFSGVEVANSAGMGLVVILLHRAQKLGASVVFVAPREQPKALFDRLELSRRGPVYPTLQQALASL